MREKTVPIQLPKNLLSGQSAIVTGASRGIGRATALRLAEAGANVVVNYYQNKTAAEEVVSLCRQSGVEAFAVQADVAKLEDARHLMAETLEHFGKVDILVANAGVWEGAPVN